MTHDEMVVLATAIAAALSENHPSFVCAFDPQRRKSDHEWVLLQREKEREKIEFWKSLRLHVVKWGAVSLLSVLAYALWLALKQEVTK